MDQICPVEEISRQHCIQHAARLLHGAVSQTNREDSPNKEQVELELSFAGQNMNLAYTAVQQVWPEEVWLFKRSALLRKNRSVCSGKTGVVSRR